MLFTSSQFLLFFVLLWILWYLFPAHRKFVLLGGSLVFVALVSWISALLCLLLAAANFYAAGQVANGARFLLYRSMQALNILVIPLSGLLSARTLFFSTGLGDTSGILIAAGLSFYTLQHFAYLSDVHRGRMAAERDLFSFVLSSLYFPRFISGPIVMYRDMSLQITALGTARVEVFPGVYRIILGYFKKLVIADALAPSVSSVFDHYDPLPGMTVLAAAFLFSIQLYFDFSGYCDIAIGCSLLLGISLPENFNMPLRATSITEFWRRWHMTLLRFFTDYLFLPVTYRLRKLGRHAAAAGIVVVFLASALWHGLGVTFLLWGACHMAYMLTEHYLKIPSMADGPVWRGVRGFVVILLFSFSNLFFRAADFSFCAHLFSALFRAGNFFPADWSADFIAPLAVGGHQSDVFNFYLLLSVVFVFLAFEEKFIQLGREQLWKPVPAFLLLMLIFLFGVFASTGRFIYMQF